MSTQFDVFLSYNWRDHRHVERLAQLLEEQGVSAFLDRWHLVPGRPWPERLEQLMRTCHAVVVCVGPGEMGTWQQREKHLALERQGSDRQFSVIPVLLPGADPALGFLGQNTWVDLRDGVEQRLLLEVLARAVRGLPPNAELSERSLELRARISPYKGLAYFREEDAAFFVGRETTVDLLVQALERRNLVAVVGGSGSGKSSVVRAGLLPRLRGDVKRPWEIATLTPNDQPFYRLAACLVPLLAPATSDTDRLVEQRKLATALADATVPLRDVIEAILQKQPGTSRFLLVVDQWEELYTLTGEGERTRFIDTLLAATAVPSLSLVLTLRGDFVGKAIAYRPLCDCLQDAQINLGPMRRDEVARAIATPADKVNMRFEEGLVERILDEVGEEPGNLPLLEFVLQRLWEDAVGAGGVMRHSAYEAMGRVRGALARTADAVYERLDDAEKPMMQRLLLQLVQPVATGEDTRRRATFEEIGEPARALVVRLADERLVVTTRDETSGVEFVEVAHEALINHWARFSEWLAQNRQFLEWRRKLRQALGEWQSHGREPDALLRGGALQDAERWLMERGIDLNVDERNYILLGVDARVVALRRRTQRPQLRFDDALLKLAARLLEPLMNLIVRWSKVIAPDLVDTAVALSFAPNKDTLLICTSFGRLMCWDVGTRMVLSVQQLSSDDIASAAFSPDAALVAFSKHDGEILVHETATSQRVSALRLTDDVAVGLAISSTGVLSFVSRAHVVGWWNVRTGETERISHTSELEDRAIALSRDGQIIAVGGPNQRVDVWGPRHGAELRRLHRSFLGLHLMAVALTAQGELVAGGCYDEKVYVWATADGKRVAKLHAGGNAVRHVAFSPDGRLIAAGTARDGIRIWDLATRTELGASAASQYVTSLAFSDDAETLLFGDRTGHVTVWDVRAAQVRFQIALTLG